MIKDMCREPEATNLLQSQEKKIMIEPYKTDYDTFSSFFFPS